MTKHINEKSAKEPGRGKHVWLICILGALGAFGPLSMDMYLPSLPSLTGDLHTTTSLAQLSITGCLIGLAVGQIVIGPFSDSRGRRAPLLAGLLLFTATSFLCTIVTSIGWLIFLRLMQGIAGSAGLVISRAIARDFYSGKKLTQFFSMLMAVNGLFPILAPIIGGFVLRFTSWHGIFVILGLIGFSLFLGAFFGLPESLPPGKRMTGGIRGSFSAIGSLFRNKVFIGYAAVQGLIMGAMFCYIAGSSFVLQEMFGVSPFGFSLFFATNGLGIVLMSQVAGFLSGRTSEKKILGTGTWIAALGSLALFFSLFLHPVQLIAVIVPLFFVVSMVGLVNTTAFSLAMQSQGQVAGSAAAILGLGMNTVGGVLSPLVGIGGSHTYFPMALLILLCDAGALLIYLLLLRKQTA
ncbi:Bcr/CflA family efflux MFS transporter [Sporolactobacillus sp. THM7-7]|nr:Bcr/CflA family efflux MFS transporter [Sporolactobacillus sp. THM7-7]